MPLLTTLQSSLANWVLRSSQYNCKLGNQIANFETYLSTLVLLNFITSYLFLIPGNCNIMNPNPFTKQGKGYRVRPVKWFTVDKWLEGSKPFQVVHQLKLMEKDGNKYCRSVRTYRKVLQVQYVYYGNNKNSSSKIGLLTRKGCWLQSPFWTFKESTSTLLNHLLTSFFQLTKLYSISFWIEGKRKEN